MFLNDNGVNGSNGGKALRNKKRVIESWTFRLPKEPSLSPIRFLQKLGTKVVSAIRDFSIRTRSSRKVSSSTFVRSSSLLSHPIESHHAKYVEDCIEFLHSSSSRERPSSASENSC
ncbi:hypothetical protein Lalb_Chr13g0291241 [Lupinus albus]|uniref:Uncharacterized protein n=1 Tax=Lupinus albus TaxID=3870 RepID=A0A6A4PH21_LUPAL|nr:hypothetical protein Lalb_Chr13g0291241 [Lupinus albus]